MARVQSPDWFRSKRTKGGLFCVKLGGRGNKKKRGKVSPLRKALRGSKKAANNLMGRKISAKKGKNPFKSQVLA